MDPPLIFLRLFYRPGLTNAAIPAVDDQAAEYICPTDCPYIEQNGTPIPKLIGVLEAQHEHLRDIASQVAKSLKDRESTWTKLIAEEMAPHLNDFGRKLTDYFSQRLPLDLPNDVRDIRVSLERANLSTMENLNALSTKVSATASALDYLTEIKQDVSTLTECCSNLAAAMDVQTARLDAINTHLAATDVTDPTSREKKPGILNLKSLFTSTKPTTLDPIERSMIDTANDALARGMDPSAWNESSY